MTNPEAGSKPNNADYRRAAVLTLHHRRGDRVGMVAIAEESNALNRGAELLKSVLLLHQTLIGLLRTANGITLLAPWVASMASMLATEPPQTDIIRAAQILNFHGQGNKDGIASVVNSADGRMTQVLLALLDLYEVALPELSGTVGVGWLESQIQGFLEMEHGLDDFGE
ncbi:hypothetical protein MTY66_60250 [Mycolicibacterium sp. TY66]|uniref:hypothetical protein n=1 Tax=unclassified Mycolicibacterium TaxID=2636767 RepID=UPI001BB429BA|nr:MULTISPECIES: hypothetical protein [unclassified Mycolicibacterium]BCI84400.1 hypothetical protein MTY66_60250 [Mycolicibacterium sp. TY66]BCJ83979.1 hypothetical protein MTY81_53520 [Mycolicibacterium sp. TY81]